MTLCIKLFYTRTQSLDERWSFCLWHGSITSWGWWQTGAFTLADQFVYFVEQLWWRQFRDVVSSAFVYERTATLGNICAHFQLLVTDRWHRTNSGQTVHSQVPTKGDLELEISKPGNINMTNQTWHQQYIWGLDIRQSCTSGRRV